MKSRRFVGKRRRRQRKAGQDAMNGCHMPKRLRLSGMAITRWLTRPPRLAFHPDAFSLVMEPTWTPSSDVRRRIMLAEEPKHTGVDWASGPDRSVGVVITRNADGTRRASFMNADQQRLIDYLRAHPRVTLVDVEELAKNDAKWRALGFTDDENREMVAEVERQEQGSKPAE